MEEEDVKYNFEKGNQKFKKLADNIPKPLIGLWEDLKTMIFILGDFITGKYRDIPWKTIAAITAAVAYFVSPVDIIPDIIPVLGFLDDALVLKLCLDFCREDIEKYREWKKEQGE